MHRICRQRERESESERRREERERLKEFFSLLSKMGFLFSERAYIMNDTPIRGFEGVGSGEEIYSQS